MKIIAYTHEKRLIDIIYKPKIRAENETRTRDPNLGKVVLYQLSYFRINLCCNRPAFQPLITPPRFISGRVTPELRMQR